MKFNPIHILLQGINEIIEIFNTTYNYNTVKMIFNHKKTSQ